MILAEDAKHASKAKAKPEISQGLSLEVMKLRLKTNFESLTCFNSLPARTISYFQIYAIIVFRRVEVMKIGHNAFVAFPNASIIKPILYSSFTKMQI